LSLSAYTLPPSPAFHPKGGGGGEAVLWLYLVGQINRRLEDTKAKLQGYVVLTVAALPKGGTEKK
jgi:hypothetical protein